VQVLGPEIPMSDEVVAASVAAFDNTHAPVRAHALQLAVELYRCFGKIMVKRYEGLRAVQFKDYLAAVEGLPEVMCSPISIQGEGERENERERYTQIQERERYKQI